VPSVLYHFAGTNGCASALAPRSSGPHRPSDSAGTFRAIVSSEPTSEDQSSRFAASTAGSALPAARTSCSHRSLPSASPATGWSNGIEALCSFSGL
jgi:hypothetical protein